MKRKNIFLEQPEEEFYKSKSLYPMKKMNQLSKIAKIENRNFSQKNLKAKTNLLTKEMTTSLFFLKK